MSDPVHEPADPSTEQPGTEATFEVDVPSWIPPAVPWANLVLRSPTLVATTLDLFNRTVSESLAHAPPCNRPSSTETGPTCRRGGELNYPSYGEWSPDGSLFLTTSNDQCLRMFALPEAAAADASPALDSSEPWTAFRCLREGEATMAATWYPGFSYYDPATWCLAVSTRDHPIRLWNAYSGTPVGSYLARDDREQVLSANALRFNLDGSRLYAGYRDLILEFDTHRPGEPLARHPTRSTRRSRTGQRGIVSALAFNPDRSGLYAVGTFHNSVGLYTETDHRPLYLKQPPNGQGISQVQFSPCGHYLYIGTRKDALIYCWDIRQSGQFLFHLDRAQPTTSDGPVLAVAESHPSTHQRLTFDLDPTGQVLATGTVSVTAEGRACDGSVSFIQAPVGPSPDPSPAEAGSLLYTFQAHEDIVNTVKFHPHLPLLATVAGQREATEIDSSSEGGDDDISDPDSTGRLPARPDNSVRLWRYNSSTGTDDVAP
ncbi:hypothetical protein IWQ60_000116 [Tieghemiomyces parasiticus]|uniref:Telomerase Cajal body protein 1 n=1 Tax=Tieghemiomyces parasiticus TaxID=78921 RepID=A0A9W8AFB7_9FUNG|nr:hypothetical protein IWQ60_000116 [Tieghemiomyces parasiticus]